MSSSWAVSLRSRLAIDLRGLALLRAGLGTVLLIDALLRLCSADLLYADTGLLPRAAAAVVLEPARISLHLANGSTAFALALTLLQALAAAALLLGWRTRVAVLLSALLAISAAARNPLVVTAGDAFAITLLILGLFLPLAARWSVDASRRHQTQADHAHSSLAGALLLALSLALFLFPALRLSGSVGLQTLTLPGGMLDSLRAGLDAALWWSLLLIAPLALLARALDTRVARICGRVALGLMLLFCLLAQLPDDAGSLSWLGLCVAALWIDPALWAGLGSQDERPGLRVFHAEHAPGARALALVLREMLCLPMTSVAVAAESPRALRLILPGKHLVVFDRDDSAHLDAEALRVLLLRSPLLRPLRGLLSGAFALGLCERLLRVALRRAREPSLQARELAPLLQARGRKSQFALLGLALIVALAQLAPRGPDAPAWGTAARGLLQPLGLDHDWIWRAPVAGGSWLATPGERADGSAVDARSRVLAAANYARDQLRLLPGARNSVYERRLLDPAAGQARLALARYLCAQRGDALAGVRVVQMLPSESPGAAPAEQRVLLRQDCR